MKMFQMKKSSFGRITKDGQETENITENILETQKYPTQRSENITVEEIQHYHRQLNLNSQISSTVSLNTPSKEEIINILKSINNNKASGDDGVVNEVLQYSNQFQKHLIKIFQRFFREGELKENEEAVFCQGKVIFLYKGNGEKENPSSYRPITLLQTSLKTLTKIINSRLENAIQKIPSYQAGFRKYRATTHKIEILKPITMKNVRENLGLKMLFIDFKKAFDSVSHCFICLSLREHGVPKSLIKKIMYLYSLAKVKVVEGEKESKTTRILKGVM
eukprot:snap_masked-scaffold_6-processed-gene-17.6-mRNA-1 protein AED:1.00 eAED:1.00 QI:0/0/0/0/1/1/2/0/275